MDAQEYQEIQRMETLSAIYDAVEAWKEAKMEPRHRKVILWLEKAGLMSGVETKTDAAARSKRRVR